ncbi:MAG: MOSC domain-containing protein [Ruminococcus sp.]|nr:MOSC domain-containing protein [Ruminococcus sp.]
MAKVEAVCLSEKKGVKKHPVPFIELQENYGILGDAHAGNWHRQVSLLATESVDQMRPLLFDLQAGDFAENILTCGITVKDLPIGTRLSVGEAILEITQIGKECHKGCEIQKLTGKCVMPTEGVFAIVLKGGKVQKNDPIEVLQ